MLLLPFQEEKEGDASKDSLDDLFPNEEEEDPSNGCESMPLELEGEVGAARGLVNTGCSPSRNGFSTASGDGLGTSTLIPSASPLFINVYSACSPCQALCQAPGSQR